MIPEDCNGDVSLPPPAASLHPYSWSRYVAMSCLSVWSRGKQPLGRRPGLLATRSSRLLFLARPPLSRHGFFGSLLSQPKHHLCSHILHFLFPLRLHLPLALNPSCCSCSCPSSSLPSSSSAIPCLPHPSEAGTSFHDLLPSPQLTWVQATSQPPAGSWYYRGSHRTLFLSREYMDCLV